MEPVIFWAAAAAAGAAAVAVVAQRNALTSALALVANLVAVAVLYALLDAPLVAAVQILVYVGAVMVLFVFVIMILGARGETQPVPGERRSFPGWFPAAAGLAVVVGAAVLWRAASRVASGWPTIYAQPGPGARVKSLAWFLYMDYAFPVELVSLLLLIAMVGVMVLARRDGHGGQASERSR